ncbi:MEDS domain-containing protein [Actinokineospora terrae]|uniref:Anti-anti-sigma regulatory factor (Antagonist of anti-sigma factor) n=1 Tax=Actinokineospora terrae TaxID=155974 RepID=A0A1H9X338_9PSEU|nr:MEDS domain-containing protein [Actinokineospora terrae]SES40525.1 Anti-anti-sigma regulatory factor (antagonist of anti-sigma factor) [Actinokineospora terrae]
MSQAPGADRETTTGGRGHLCWAFADVGEFVAGARAFLVEGLAQGKRVCVAAPGDVAELGRRFADVPGFDDLLDRGAVQLRSLDRLYETDVAVDADEQVRTYAAETGAALAAGFTGFRVAVEATRLVRTPAQLAAFASYEHTVDRYMAAYPFEALCAYSVPTLGTEVVDKLAGIHPRGNVEHVPFRLHGWGACGAVALEGELDLRSHELFGWALERAAAHWGPGEVVVDARELTFIDHHGLLGLAEQAARRGITIVLRTRRFGAARLVDILGIDGVRVEQAA